jgi:hypothetical protein
MGDDNKYKIIGMGDVRIFIFDGVIHIDLSHVTINYN